MTDQTVAQYLRTHRGPVTLRALSDELQMSRRAVELEIQRLRLAGMPIVTSEDGAKWSQDPAELRACAARLLHRLSSQAATAHALNKTADLMAQKPLELWS